MPGALQKKVLRLVLSCSVFWLAGCTKKEIPAEVPVLTKQQDAATKRLGEMDGEIKSVADDPVAAAALAEDKELLKSRLERIKEQLHKFAPGEPAEAPAGGGHH